MEHWLQLVKGLKRQARVNIASYGLQRPEYSLLTLPTGNLGEGPETHTWKKPVRGLRRGVQNLPVPLLPFFSSSTFLSPPPSLYSLPPPASPSHPFLPLPSLKLNSWTQLILLPQPPE